MQDVPGDPLKDVGARIMQWRQARQLTLSRLAEDVKVSASQISQIERGVSRPSLGTLLAIAMALNVSIEDLIPLRPRPADDGDPRFVVRHDNRERIEISGGVTWERLNSDADETGVEFLELIYEPGAESGARPYTHEGREMTVVTEGRMVVEVGFRRFVLKAGDSITLPSTLPHRYSNPGNRVARGISVIFQQGTRPSVARRQAAQDEAEERSEGRH